MNKPGAGHHAFHLFSSLPAHSPLSKPTLATKRKRVCCCLSTALHAILTFSHVRPIAPTHMRCFFASYIFCHYFATVLDLATAAVTRCWASLIARLAP
jgi:hypothetical protein